MVDIHITCIVLAAGESKRMGQPKLLLPLGESTVGEHTIDNFLNSKLKEVIVVLGDRADEMTRRIGSRPVKIVINPAYRQGMSISIASGLSLLSEKAQAVMLSLGDQPFIDPQAINRLTEAFSTHNRGIAIPVYRGRRGHPVIFSIKYKEALLSLKGDIGGRQIIEKHPDDILEVDVDCEGITIDIDTYENYHLTVKDAKTF